MKKVKDLFAPQYQDVDIDGFSLKFKKLTWKELKDFEKKAKELQVDEIKEAEEIDETAGVVNFFIYLTRNFVFDGDLKVICEEEQAEDLPFGFCVSVVNKFVEVTQGGIPSGEDAKKK